MSEEEPDFTGYVFPDTVNRRISGWMFEGLGIVAIVLWVAFRTRSQVANVGLLAGGVLLIALGVYFLGAGFRLGLDQQEALIIANREIGFPVGHASAVLGWRGWRARPTWRILVYSAEDPPARRGLVEIDAVSGKVLGSYAGENPEDWDRLRAEEESRPS